jgi:magnesium chelatase accessory protein
MLALRYQVLALDLPGHAFTSMPQAAQQSLPGMAGHVAALLAALRLSPDIVVGHSAGAAIAARMLLDGMIAPAPLVSLNGAFVGLPGLAGQWLSPIARLLASVPLAPQVFAWQASDPGIVEQLIRGTGSVLDSAGMKFYARLVRNAVHVEAMLAMLAHWDLDPLERELHRMSMPVSIVTAENDLTVPPAQARQVIRQLPQAQLTMWPGLGHLAHEEKPAQCARLIAGILKQHSLMPASGQR